MPGPKSTPLLTVAVSLTGLCLSSCATKSAALHSPAPFNPSPTRQATNAVDAGDGDMEIADLRRTVMSHPDDIDARLRLAQAYSAHGFADVALEHYRLATERFPASPKAALSLTLALRKADQKDQALAALKSFLHAHPQQNAEPYEWLGIVNDDLKNWKDSQSAYEAALLYAPQSAELHNNLGYALLMQYRNEDAAKEFRAALRLKHDLAIARNNLGIALAGNPNEAILNWQSVSGPSAAHNNMAAVLIEQGKIPEARKELETALGYDRQNGQALYNLALVAEKDGKPAVVPSKEAALKKSSKNPFAWLLHMGRHAEKPPETQTVAASGN